MPPMKKPSRGGRSLHSLTHLAKRWTMTRREVRRLLQSGRIGFEQVCGELCVPEDEVRRFERASGRRS
ncbi:MAG: hypothetical protein AAGA92_01535 [Planctomycetota bacterium]